MECYINGKQVYPASGEKIKVTLGNEYVSETGTSTLDVSFPLDYAPNRDFFGAIGRIDVSKRTMRYDDCQLISDGHVILHGMAVVTEISESRVKLQLSAGKSATNQADWSERIYIDEINYDQSGLDPVTSYNRYVWAREQIDSKGYLGVRGKAIYTSIWDAQNNMMYNRTRTMVGVTEFSRPAIHPNLWYVVEGVMSRLGVELTKRPFGGSPFDDIYIANARLTQNIKDALPHWTAKKFLMEVENLFSGKFVFEGKKATFLNTAEMDMEGVEYEVDDTFTSDYDENGISINGNSNLHYDLVNAESRKKEQAPDDVWKKFTIRRFTSYHEMENEMAHLPDQDRRTSMCFDGDSWWYLHYDEENSFWEQFGWFNDLRINSSAEVKDLHIVPVEILPHEINPFLPEIYLPTTESDTKQSDSEKYYISVQDIIENSAEEDGASTDAKSEDDVMEVYLWESDRSETAGDSTKYWYMVAKTHSMSINGQFWGLQLYHCAHEVTLGMYHEQAGKALNVDIHHQQVFKFLCDGLPDPTSIYIFRGKKFLCAKIDVTVSDEGIDRLKTGYFHELL